MARLGVITDGISRDFGHALEVMTAAGLEWAELQFLWDKEVGDLSENELIRAKDLLDRHGAKVSCISRHNFGGLPVLTTEVDDPVYRQHMAALGRCIDMAKGLGTELVRIMSFRKEMILFGRNGAEHWVTARGAWDRLKRLLEPPLELAEARGVTLVVETGNNAMITSAALGRRLIEELGSTRLRILWDPANSLYCNEPPWPDGYEALAGGHLGHVHIKDARVDIPRATVEFCPLGTGDMASHLDAIAAGLRRDGYPGVVSLESVYRPEGGDFEDGFAASLDRLKSLFG